MKTEKLVEQIFEKKTFLCVGLDTDPTKIPSFLSEFSDPVFEFNRRIIDATAPYCVSYKINTAFYEALGSEGWRTMEKTEAYIKDSFFKIADAKRGDIGNTSTMYAKAFFERMNFDAVTVSPYMGEDSVGPFLEFEDRHTIMLALTSNKGSVDFQTELISSQTPLYEEVIQKSKTWKNSGNLMYVVGATRLEQLASIRKIIGDSFILMPGVGAQGASLRESALPVLTPTCGLLVNSSRGIIYASSGENFADVAALEAQKLQREMAGLLAEL